MTKWKLVPVEPTPEMNSIGQLTLGYDWVDIYVEQSADVYSAMLAAAPQPPRLSDEQIREIWIEHGLDDEDVEGFARAVEREILGGGE